MAQSNVKKYLEEREKKQQTAGKVSGGSFGSADKVNAYLQQREERISASKELSEQRQRDIEIGAKAQEMRIANQKAAQERIAAREAERKKASQFSYDEFKAAANRGAWGGGWLLDLLTPSVEPPKNTTLPGYIKPVTDTQSYRDALAALPKLPEKQNPAQSTQFNAGNYLKGALAAGWAGIGSNIAKGVNAALEPLQEAGVDALQWVSKRTALPDISDETANILKGRKALGSLYDWAVDPAERTAAYAQQEAAKGGYWAEVGNQVIQSAVQQIPNMIASAATGGGQLAADLGSQAAGGFGAAVLERAKALVSSPAFANSYVQMYGQRFEDAQADGANAYAATLAATITTLMNSAVEMGGGLEGLPFTENDVADWVVSALDEGKEEMIQQVIDQLGQKAFINKNVPWYSEENEQAVINPKTLLENLTVGTLAGATLGAPAAVLNRLTGATAQENEEIPDGATPMVSEDSMPLIQEYNKLHLDESGKYPAFTSQENAAMRRLAEQTVERQMQEATPQSAALTAPLGEGEPDTSGKARAVSPTIERMAQEYGEDASVFKSNYNGSDPAQYKRGFDAMFNAGKSGLSLEMLGGVSDQLTAGMDEATKQSIYTAGLNKAAQTITPGAKNLTTGKLTSEQRTFLRVWDAIGKEYGFEVDLVDDVKGANGAYRTGRRRIVVSANAAEGAYIQAAGHETVHYLKSVNPEGYNVLEETVLKYLTDEDSMFDLETAIRERMKEYAGKSLTREEAIEEIVAEAVPTFFSDRAAATEFANRNPTLAEKIRDFFYDFVNKVREIAERYMQSQNRDEIANLLGKTEALTEIARTLDTALRGAQEKAGEAKGDGEIKTAKRRSKDADDLSKWTPDARFMEEIMTAAERGVFRTIMNDRKNLPAKKMPNGEYVIEAGRALVYTDGKLTKPRIRKIVYFYTNDGTDLDGAMDLWRRGEREGIEYECTRTAIEDILGEEGVMVYHNDDFREVQGEDDRRTGTNGRGFGEGNRGEVSADRGTRFSLKADREKNKQVQKAQAEDWQQVSAGEIMVKDLKVDEETVRRQASGALNKGLKDKLSQQISMAANRILRDTESKYGRDELKKKLHEIVKQYAAHGNVTLAAEELAGAVIDQSVRLKQSEAAEQYADVREQLRNAHISLTETQRQEVANEYGSVDAYRKAVFGTMNVRSEGMTLESLWDELSGQHPEIFPPDTNEAQMPGVIAQFDQMMKPRYENIHGMDTAAAVTDLALRIQGDVLGMVGAKNAAHDLYVRADTFREQVRREYDREIRAQQKARVDEFQQIAGKLKVAKDRGDDEARKKIMAEYRKALNKVDTRTAISEVRAANRVRNEQMKENRERAKLRDSIAKRANSLMNMLVKPEKGKHVPTKLQDSVLKVLEMLDINSERADYHGTETQKSKDYQGSVRWLRYFYDEVWDRQSKGETPEELDGLMMTLSERNIMDIRDAIDIFSLDGGVMALRDMDSSQLKMVDTLLKTVKQSIESIGKLWRIQRYESIIQLGDASIAEMDSRGPQKITNSMVGGARDFFVLDNMEPVSYGERLGEAGAEVIQSLMDGEKIKFGKIREASEATEKMLKEIGLRGYDIGKWRKHVQVVTLGGKNVRMTDAMLMSLYLTAKRPQGRQHLLANGMRIPTTDRTGGQVKKILLSEADLTYAAGLLSDKQRQLADLMGEYLSTAVAKWGNDVTQRLYLYDAFTEKNYWPITSDPNVLKTQEPEGERAFNAIINAGFTKPVNQKATNAVIVTDAFDVFGNHIGEMASYAGYAEAMTDTMAWLNYKQRNSETRLVEGSVKESMESLLGKGGIQYLTNLVQDINGARRGGDNMQLNKLLGNYKKAAVMGKIRVAIQQPTSIVRAAAEINPWHLIKALRPTKGLPKGKSIGEWLRSNGTVEEMQKWSNLAWWKAHGNYDIGIGKGTDAILWGDTSIKDTVMEKIATQGGLVDPGKMDDLTWAHMWLAVKSEIKRKREDLEVGSDEYFRAVAERFEYVMDRTQVVDTVMHRSALMRGKDGLVKSLTSFMSEPTKSYNMLMRAVMEVGRHPKDGAAHKKLARTTLAYVASAAATAAMTALYDVFRYRDDEDDVWTYLQGRYWGNVWQQMLKAMISNVNPLSNIPIIADVYDMTVNDGNAPTVMAFEGITDLISAMQTVNNYMNGNNSRKSTVYGVIKPVLTAVSSLYGLPLTGILTNVETIGRVFDPKWMQTKSEYATQGKAYEKLYEAIRDGNKEKAADIRRRLKEGLYGAAPKNPKEIDTGIAKYLALNDERIMKYWQMREKGNQYREMVALRKEIQKDGFTEEHVVQAGNRIESLLNNQYNEYLEDGMTGDAKELKEYAAKYDMVLEEAAAKDMEEELDPKMFQYDHLFAAIRNGDLDDVEGVAGVMEMESEAEDPEEAIRNQVSGEFREEYIAAARGGSTAKVRDLDKKLDYFGIDAEDRAAWIKKDRYEDLGEALEAGKTGKADEYVEQLRESGVSDDDIASSVSSRFKETYIDLVVKGKDDEAEELAEMLRDLGLVTPKGKNKYRQDVLDDWVEAWYKAQGEE